MYNNTNLSAALFCFSFNVMLSHEESLSLLEDRVHSGFIDKDALRKELKITLQNKNIDWTTFVVDHELITKYQAEVFGKIKCKEYLESLLRNYLTL